MEGKIIIILGVIIAIVILGSIALRPTQEGEELTPVKDEQLIDISVEEKEQIENWIITNDLNQYGDAKDTVYIGGTPLFDEQTGQTIDRYEYILSSYPDRPWQK